MRNLLLISVLFLAGCASSFKIVSQSISGDDYASIRLDVQTGESWWFTDGKWKKFEEPAPLPRSRYDVSVVSLYGDFGAVRFDIRTGRSWYAKKGHWVEIAESTQP